MAKAGPRRTAAPGGQGRSAGTRAALVEGAIEALKTVGFAGASAREIARLAGCNQTLVFYHFGSVTDLLLAALDAISERRMAAYRGVLEHAESLSDLVESARSIFTEDLDSGHVTVLVEMIAGARSVPGLGEQVAARVAPWREFAETAVRRGLASSPLARLLPAKDVAHGGGRRIPRPRAARQPGWGPRRGALAVRPGRHAGSAGRHGWRAALGRNAG